MNEIYQKQEPFSSTVFLRLPEVLKLIPVCRATWYNGMKDGRYPKPVKLSAKAIGFRVDDIQKLITELGSQTKTTIELSSGGVDE